MLGYEEIKGFEEKEAIIEMWGVNDYSCVLLKHSKQSYYLNGKWIFFKMGAGCFSVWKTVFLDIWLPNINLYH